MLPTSPVPARRIAEEFSQRFCAETGVAYGYDADAPGREQVVLLTVADPDGGVAAAGAIGIDTERSLPVPDLIIGTPYSFTFPGESTPTTITPTLKTRERGGVRRTTISGLPGLLADQLDAIADEGDRFHTLCLLIDAIIVISDEPRELTTYVATREDGRLATTYPGTRDLPVEVVLDLAEHLRDDLLTQK